MLRVILDTNVYGLLIKEPNVTEIGNQIVNDKEFVIYGFPLIRKELRDIPKASHLGRLSTRNLVLSVYDELTKGRYLKDSLQIHKLAMKFYNAYREFGGIKNWQKSNIDIDFTIVACATFTNWTLWFQMIKGLCSVSQLLKHTSMSLSKKRLGNRCFGNILI